MSSGWFKPLATVQSGCAETGPEGVAGTAEAARQGSLMVAAGDGVRAVFGFAVGPVEQAATRAIAQAVASLLRRRLRATSTRWLCRSSP